MTPVEAGAGVVDTPAPAAPAADHTGGRRPARPTDAGLRVIDACLRPTGAGPCPVAPATGTAVALDRLEVQELCDVLWRAERALCARGWQHLGRATGRWVAVLEGRLWAPDPP